jgi:hypothetical protein
MYTYLVEDNPPCLTIFALKFQHFSKVDVSQNAPEGLHAQSLVALLTNPCFKCLKTIETILLKPISQELIDCFCYLVSAI